MSRESSITEAATRLFLRKGYSGVSMEEIARESAVAKQTLYSYFNSKDDLFRAIIRNQSECFFALLPHNDNAAANMEEFLYQVGETAMDMMFKRDTLELYRLIVAEVPRFPDLGELYWQAGPQALIERMVNFLQNHGLAKDAAETATEQFLSLTCGHMLPMALLRKNYRPTKKEKEERIARAVSAFFMMNGQYKNQSEKEKETS